MVDKGWLDMEDKRRNFIVGGRTREFLIYIPFNCQWKICWDIQINPDQNDFDGIEFILLIQLSISFIFDSIMCFNYVF
ncbi:MAG: hypothetical protein Ta2E_12960 [Mycoplasmoidaceae bacterium]|nr:MAG: hypothetical protein Ta2E_12960 [Mycoplasmoidaceae bacterium]